MEHSITTTRSRLRKTSLARCILCVAVALAAWQPAPAADRDSTKYLQVFIQEPFLELRTGPGRGYPVFHAVGRDASVDVIYRRTDWFRVRTEDGVEGFARATDMAKTRLADGSLLVVPLGDLAGFASHRWEVGLLAGEYGGATLIGAHGSRSINDNLKIDFAVSQFLGNATTGGKFEVGLTHVFFPQWRISPFFELGTGIAIIEPRATLVAPIDRTDQTGYVGAGMRVYLTRRFFLRGEYRRVTVFTSRDDNEEINEWKVGLAAFF